MAHTILSFSNKDKEHISKELLRDISKKFVELRGKDNMYLASSHHDKDHNHLHIVMSGTKYMTGESNRISKKEFHELKLALDAYQKEKYPQLVHSLPEHGKSLKSQLTEKEHQLQSREGKLSQKQQILETVEAVYNKSKSKDDFLSQLKSEGYEPYYRGGNLYGVEDEGRNFRFKTLGFDKDKLDELDRKPDNEEKELKEISDLREAKSLDKENEDEREIDSEPDNEIDQPDRRF
ncbi:MAG: relaxase/mobilization nuclease domain-containing protein [Saprospiraceae bacterium]|nr:relaxase/mobilization nuclease domain-containing protein [Saprospiraceae bacterium]